MERADRAALPTVDRMMGDSTVYDEAWDETADKLVFTPTSGDENDIFVDCE